MMANTRCILVSQHLGMVWLILTFLLTILPLTEASPRCSQSLYFVSINENVASGSTVIRMDEECSNPEGNPLTYRLFSGNVDSQFLINAGTGLITVNGSPDAEDLLYSTPNPQTPYSLLLNIRDETLSRSVIITVVVSVLSLNDNTPYLENLPDKVTWPEDTPVGTILATCDLKDDDLEGYDHAFTEVEIIAGNDDGKFIIDNMKCDILLVSPLDYDDATQYSLTLRVYDLDRVNPLSSTQILTIEVTDANDNLPTCSAYNNLRVIADGSRAGTVVETLNCQDVDSGLSGTIEYSVIAGDVDTMEIKNSTVGEISLKRDLDFELGDTFLEILVRVRDLGDPSFSTTVTVGLVISDVDDNPPQFPQSEYTAEVIENAAIGMIVISPIASDRDSPNTDLSRVTYGFDGPCSQDWFRVDPSTGAILVDANLDYETAPDWSCDLFAYSSDKVDNRTITRVIININDINDATPQFSEFLFRGSVQENAGRNTPIITLTAVDNDAGSNGQFTFSLPKPSPFAIHPESGLVTLDGTVDFEAEQVHLVVVQVTDKGVPPLSAQAVLSISVEPVNEYDPVLNPIGDYTVGEFDLPGTYILTATASDADMGADGEVEFFLQDEDDVPFVLEAESGRLVIGVVLDRETAPSHQLTIWAVDQSKTTKRSVSTVFTVTVTDENDNAPTCDALDEIIITPDTGIGDLIGTLVCRDADLSTPTVRYSKSSGDPRNYFTIDLFNGSLYMASRPPEGSYKVMVVVNDGGTNPLLIATMPIFIQVRINLQLTNLPQSRSLLENTTPGSTIQLVRSSGAYDLVTYTILNGNEDSVFHMHQSTGHIRLLKQMDREARDLYTLQIQAATANGFTTDSTLNITVTDVNDNAPVFAISFDYVRVSEFISFPTLLRRITATDEDLFENSVISYSIQSGNDEGKFSYDAFGNLNLVSGLDHESTPSYTLVLAATDGGFPQLSSTTVVHIEVQNVDESVPIVVTSGDGTLRQNVPENFAIGGLLFTVVGQDLDTGSELIYSIVSGNEGGVVFFIDKNTGGIYLTTPLDRETKDSYRLVLGVENEIGARAEADLVITVTDVNDNDPKFTTGNYVFQAAHNTAAGNDIGTLEVTDKDEGVNGQVRLSITSGDPSGRFTVQGMTIRSAAVLDAPVQNLYSLQVEAIDRGTAARTSTAFVTVHIQPEFRQPTFSPDIDSVTVEETRQTGSLVYDSDATSAGAVEGSPDGDIEYTIVSGNDENTFYIEKFMGLIQLQGPLNFQATPSYTLVIRADNRGDSSVNDVLTLTIRVTQMNQHSPVFSDTLYRFTINEDADVGEPAGKISATDEDIGNFGEVSYAIESNLDFEVDATDGNVKVARALDYTQAKNYYLYVLAVDNAGLTSRTATSVVIISVIDANNHAPTFSNSPSTLDVPETLSPGTDITVIKADDLDSEHFGPLLYSITSGNADNRFAINETTGVLSLNLDLDFEMSSQHAIEIQASDAGSPPMSGTLTVTVNVIDENDVTPNFGTSRMDVLISSTAPPLTIIHTAVATDSDTGIRGEVFYLIESGNTEGLFTVDFSTGAIRTTRFLDGVSDVPTLTIIAVDKGTPALTGTVTVGMTLDPITTPLPSDYSFSVAENQVPGTSVGTLPRNGGLTITGYTISSGNFGPSLTITQEGEIRTTVALDREQYPFFQLTVIIEHTGGSLDVTVFVTVTDENDHAPTLTPDPLRLSVVENLPAGNQIGSFTVADADDSGVNSEADLHISGTLFQKYFSVDSTGAIRLVQSLNYEGPFKSFTFVVVATDRGSPALSSSATVVVTVTDVLETVIIEDIEPGIYITTEIPYNLETGSVVYTLSLADFGLTAEAGDTVRFITAGETSVFNVDPESGMMTVGANSLIYDAGSRYLQWVVGEVTSGNTTRAKVGLVRVDTFKKISHLVAIVVATDKDSLNSNRTTLQARLQSFFSSPRSVRIWDIQDIGGTPSRRRLLATESVVLAVVAEDAASDELGNVDAMKTFMNQADILTVLQASTDGTPVAGLSDATIPVSNVIRYDDSSVSDSITISEPYMIVLISVSVVAVIVIIAVVTAVIFFNRKRGDPQGSEQLAFTSIVAVKEDSESTPEVFGPLDKPVLGSNPKEKRIARAGANNKLNPLKINGHLRAVPAISSN